MTQTIAHFVFTLSGAGCLVQALRKAGRDDLVVATCHDLNFGPIDPSDPSARAKWLENELGQIDRKDAGRSERVCDEARFPRHRKVAWFTRRSAMEYAGFLDWLWHRGDTPCDVVDLSEVELSYPPAARPTRTEGFAQSCFASSRYHSSQQALGFGSTVTNDRTAPISRTLGTAYLRKRAATRDRRRQTCVDTDFIFRFDVDVLCDGQVAASGDRLQFGNHLPLG